VRRLPTERRVRDFENRPLTYHEKQKMNIFEKEVMQSYESILKRPFMTEDVIPLKLCLRFATPAQIKSMMFRFKPQKNFIDFFYLVKPCKQIFKNRRGGKKYDKQRIESFQTRHQQER